MWIAAIGATYYLLLMFTSVPVDTPLPDTAGLIRIALVMVLMPLTYLTILRSLWRQMTLYNNEQQVERQRQDYNAILQKMDMEKIYRHDMRHHLLVLEACRGRRLLPADSIAAWTAVAEAAPSPSWCSRGCLFLTDYVRGRNHFPLSVLHCSRARW